MNFSRRSEEIEIWRRECLEAGQHGISALDPRLERKRRLGSTRSLSCMTTGAEERQPLAEGRWHSTATLIVGLMGADKKQT